MNSGILGALLTLSVGLALFIFQETIGECDYSASVFGTAAGAGLGLWLSAWLVSVPLAQWKASQMRKDERDASSGQRLFESLGLIHETRARARAAVGPNGDLPGAYVTIIAPMQKRLQELGVPCPTGEDVDFDIVLACIEWEAFLERLIPLAGESNIRKARRLRSANMKKVLWQLRRQRWGSRLRRLPG